MFRLFVLKPGKGVIEIEEQDGIYIAFRMREVKKYQFKKALTCVYKCGYHERYNYRFKRFWEGQLLKSLQQGNNLFVCSRKKFNYITYG